MILIAKSSEIKKGDHGLEFTGIAATGEDINKRLKVQDYGFISRAPNGTKHIAIGNGNTLVVLGGYQEKSEMPDLGEGDVAIYTSPDYYVKVSAGGVVEVKGNGSSDSIQLGTATRKALMTDSIITKFNTHLHTETGTVTSTPVDEGGAPVTYSSLDTTSEVTAS